MFTTSWKSLSAKTVSQCNVVAATCFDMLTFLGFLSTMTMISKFIPICISTYLFYLIKTLLFLSYLLSILAKIRPHCMMDVIESLDQNSLDIIALLIVV